MKWISDNAFDNANYAESKRRLTCAAFQLVNQIKMYRYHSVSNLISMCVKQHSIQPLWRLVHILKYQQLLVDRVKRFMRTNCACGSEYSYEWDGT